MQKKSTTAAPRKTAGKGSFFKTRREREGINEPDVAPATPRKTTRPAAEKPETAARPKPYAKATPVRRSDSPERPGRHSGDAGYADRPARGERSGRPAAGKAAKSAKSEKFEKTGRGAAKYGKDKPFGRSEERAPKGRRSPKIQEPLTEVRLNRFIAMSGVCSRREADKLIEAGEVTVNGKVVAELGTKVRTSDDIRLGGERLQGERKVYILMNKPKDYVTTVEDPHADRTVIDLLRGECPQRVYPVGRLDKNTTGVLLLTNDGDLTKQLTHPSYEKKKIYHVFLDKPCTQADLDHLVKGVELEDGWAKADEAAFVEGVKKEVGLELHSGRNRVVRRMFEALGYEVVKLDRVFFAGMTKSGLRRGDWRYLTPREVSNLKSGIYE